MFKLVYPIAIVSSHWTVLTHRILLDSSPIPSTWTGDVGWTKLSAAGITDMHELVGMFFTKHCSQEEFAEWLIGEGVVTKGAQGEARAYECARALHVKFTSI
jgi:hypothetical protein